MPGVFGCVRDYFGKVCVGRFILEATTQIVMTTIDRAGSAFTCDKIVPILGLNHFSADIALDSVPDNHSVNLLSFVGDVDSKPVEFEGFRKMSRIYDSLKLKFRHDILNSSNTEELRICSATRTTVFALVKCHFAFQKDTILTVNPEKA